MRAAPTAERRGAVSERVPKEASHQRRVPKEASHRVSEEYGIRVYKETFDFASAHFLIFEDGRREELHGHNYRVRVELHGELKGDLVIDFKHVKPLVRAACKELDHRVLLPAENARLAIRRDEDAGEIEARFAGGSRFVFPAQDVIVLPVSNTSTERLARYLCGRLLPQIQAAAPNASLRAIEVEVEEASGQSGFYRTEIAG